MKRDDAKDIYYCRLCGRVGESPVDLARQGCEGIHAPYVPKADYDRALARIAKLEAK